jgi:hypothetical protein
MTIQIPDEIIYEGKIVPLWSEPLAPKLRRIKFKFYTTANWRGYRATWAIREGRLYLTKVSGSMLDGSPVSVRTFFPDTPEEAFASWYTNTLYVPRGDIIPGARWIHGPVTERLLLLQIAKGLLIQESEISASSVMPWLEKSWRFGGTVRR